MNDDTRYISEQQQRLLRVIRALAGREVDGLAPGELAKLAECSASQVTRDLANLKHIGWAEQLTHTGRWRLGPEIVQLSMRHLAALDRARTRLAEVQNRFSRNTFTDSTPQGETSR